MGDKLKVARQKIVDKRGNTVAYELLYRNSEISHNTPDDEMTLDVLVTSLLKIGYSKISDGVKLAVNFTDSELLKNITEILIPDCMILEILENTEVNDFFIESLNKYKNKGFIIALDDFKLDNIQNKEIINYVDIVKVDFMQSNEEERKEIERIMNKYDNITLLAEKIENSDEYKYALDSGYDLFQGYYISKPEIIYQSN